MNYFELQHNVNYKLHHTSYKKGYVSRKLTDNEIIAKEYNGRFGKGYTVLTPAYNTTNYCLINYYIEIPPIYPKTVKKLDNATEKQKMKWINNPKKLKIDILKYYFTQEHQDFDKLLELYTEWKEYIKTLTPEYTGEEYWKTPCPVDRKDVVLEMINNVLKYGKITYQHTYFGDISRSKDKMDDIIDYCRTYIRKWCHELGIEYNALKVIQYLRP
ncbi:hypothetical protein J6V85_03355 [Candidatus Saccharibacteria bacterium]|nr:hypothetical protein [Candidatus Saccharibacteria bacterium]